LTLPVALVPVWPKPVMNSPSWKLLAGCTVPTVLQRMGAVIAELRLSRSDRKGLSL
jgi:hypothetical protein